MNDNDPRNELTMTNLHPSSRPGSIPSLTYPDLNPGDASSSLAAFIKILSRYRWMMMAIIGLTIAAVVLFQFLAPKVYEASTLLRMERHSAGGVVGQAASQVSSVDDMDQIIATQLELAKSDPVLRPVEVRYKILEAEGQLKGLTPEQAARVLRAPTQLRHLTVTRPPNTYLIRIAYRAHDPQLAANVANGIAESLIEHNNNTGDRSSLKISATVAKHMTELRAKMEAADGVLAAFEKDLNMDPEQRITMQAARLAQLNTEFTTVQAERIRRESILAGLVGPVTLASAQAAQAESQESTLLNDTEQRLNTARQQFASVRSYYGEGHPEYLKAKQQVEEVQLQLSEMQVRSKERAKDEYKEVLGRENRLLGLVQRTKAEVDGLKARAHQYEQLRSEADSDRKVYQELATQADVADINRQFQNETVQIVAPALPPQESLSPKILINLPLALLASGMLGAFILMVRHALDTTFSDPEDIASQLHVDVLSAIPAAKSLPSIRVLESGSLKLEAEPTTGYMEGIRYLRRALIDKSVRNLLVTSALQGEGKSTTSAYLAAAYAQLGKKVLLIDADFRHPTLHKHFGIANVTGLSDVLLGSPCDSAIIALGQSGLYIMPAGSALQSSGDKIMEGFSAILDEVSRQCDIVIVDSSPMLGFPESQDLAGIIDSVLIVTKASATAGKMVSRTLDLLNRTRNNVVGVVMNQVKFSEAGGYGYSYYSRATDDELRSA